MMRFQTAPSTFPAAVRPVVPLIRSACLDNLAPAIRRIADRLGPPSDRRIRNLVTAGGQAARIDYDRDALEYNRTYFLRNTIKCLTISQILLSDWDEIGNGVLLDVGGGIGTFALSLWEHRRWSRRIVIDGSRTQIKLGHEIVGSTVQDHRMKWCIFRNIPPARSSDPTAVFSYSLCESPYLLEQAFEMRWRTALVVDYPKTIDRCAEYAEKIGARFASTHVSIKLCPDLAGIIGKTSISANGAMIVRD